MYSTSILGDIMRLELALGHSHQCHECGSTFLAHEDGCPNCGRGARTSLINPPVQVQECENDNWLYCIIWDRENGLHIVGQGDFSVWPRVSK